MPTCHPRRLRALTALGCCALAAGCATLSDPQNPQGVQYQPAQQLAVDAPANVCRVPEMPSEMRGLERIDPAQLSGAPDTIAPGDRLALNVSGDKDVLTGTYVVPANGRLTIGDAIEVAVEGQTVGAVERGLRARLVRDGLVRDIAGNVRLTQIEVAGVPVGVSGAVFEPGTVRAGERAGEARAAAVDHPAFGDHNGGRTLSTALRGAGGLRPDAAMNAIVLLRGGTYAVIDASPALSGGAFVDPQLAPGDRIVVPSAGCFQPALVRPTSVTAPGIRIYLSNLSRPAASNGSSAIGKESTSLPYGTRLLQGLISANCVGGSSMNAGRHAVLISRNLIDGRAVVISRSVEGLVHRADRDDFDPYLMPGDSIACYDSAAMSLVDAVSVASSALTPAVLIRGLKP